MKATKKQNLDKKKRIVIIFLLLIIFVGLMILFARPKRSSYSIPEKSAIITQTTEPDPYAGRRVVDKYPNQNILWYQVHLQTNMLSNGINRNPPLLSFDVLPELFDLPIIKEPHEGSINAIEKIIYNTQTGYLYKGETKDQITYRQYNSDFFMAVKGFSLDISKTYKNNIAKASLSYVNPEIIPYLEDKNYCENDNDCMIRNSFCGYGSFNKYETYADIYGCESPPYDLEIVNASGQPIFYDEQYDPTMKCNVKAHYAGVQCVNHQCKGTGRTLSCVNN